MRLEIQYQHQVTVLPGAVADRLCDAGVWELKLIIALLSEPNVRAGGEIADLDAVLQLYANRFGCAKADMDAALAYWRGVGVLRVCDAPAAETLLKEAEQLAEGAMEPADKPIKLRPADHSHVYGGQELEDIYGRNPGIRHLVDECQNILGKMFNPNEASKIVGLSEELGLEDAHILLLASYCRGLNKRSVSYLERTAYNLYNEGIDTTAAFEEYIKAAERAKNRESRLRRLFGIGERTLTAKEKGWFRKWFEEFGMSYELVERAYEITVDQTDKLSLPYLDKVLTNWHAAGCKTMEDVDQVLADFDAGRAEKAATKPVKAARIGKEQPGTGGEAHGSFDTDSFFELALARSRDAMRSPKKSEEEA